MPTIRKTDVKYTIAIAAFLISVPGSAADERPSPKFEPASACKTCHAREYREWKSSWMSRAFTNDVFQADYRRMIELEGTVPGADRRQCLRCHAPTALITGDVAAETALATDGVTCDLCHSVALIRDREGISGLGIDPRGVRYGVSVEPKLAPHPMAPSPALRDPRLCAACHHDELPGNVPLERTYAEWRDSPYAAAGVVCVDCHMAPDPGEPAGRVSHRFAGGHATSTLLPGAATVAIRPAAASGFDVEVVNARVGHHFPTAGAHPNRLVLSVTGYDDAGDAIWDERRLYRFRYLNDAGEEVHGTEPVSSVEDTTLAPHVPRVEHFAPDTAAATRRIVAELVYELVPPDDRARIGAELYDAHYRPVVIARYELDVP